MLTFSFSFKHLLISMSSLASPVVSKSFRILQNELVCPNACLKAKVFVSVLNGRASNER